MNAQSQQWAATANQREGQLLAMIEELRTQVSQLQQQAVPVRKRQVLPEPNQFSGRTKDWDIWSMTMQAKLRIDGEAIGGNEAQLYYVYSSLEKKVQGLVLAFVRQAQEDNKWEPLTLLSYLGRIYNDPNKAKKAGQRLIELRQGTTSVAIYLPQFEKVLFEAGANTWPDNAKITTLVGGLNKYTRQRINGQLTVPTDYDEFVQMLQMLGNQFGYSNNNGNSNAMEWEPVRVATAKTAPRTSKEQRQGWRDNGKCVRCGSGKHWVDKCSYQATRSRSSSVSSEEDKRVNVSAVRPIRTKTTAKSVHLGKGKGLDYDPWEDTDS